jgi:hypothetical protein
MREVGSIDRAEEDELVEGATAVGANGAAHDPLYALSLELVMCSIKYNVKY